MQWPQRSPPSPHSQSSYQSGWATVNLLWRRRLGITLIFLERTGELSVLEAGETPGELGSLEQEESIPTYIPAAVPQRQRIQAIATTTATAPKAPHEAKEGS